MSWEEQEDGGADGGGKRRMRKRMVENWRDMGVVGILWAEGGKQY